MGAVHCGCAADCWCKRPIPSTFRWVFPYGVIVPRLRAEYRPGEWNPDGKGLAKREQLTRGLPSASIKVLTEPLSKSQLTHGFLLLFKILSGAGLAAGITVGALLPSRYWLHRFSGLPICLHS